MTERTCPYSAWVLTPTFNPKEVVFVKKESFYHDYQWTEKGKAYHVSEIYPTKTDAILAGNERVAAQQAAHDKSQLRINTRRKNLALASRDAE